MTKSGRLFNVGRILEVPASVVAAVQLTWVKKGVHSIGLLSPCADNESIPGYGHTIMTQFFDENRTETGVSQPERRKQLNLRDIFDDVVRLVEPYFQHGVGLNGRTTDYWASRAIRDVYSDLSSQEVQMLTAAAARYCREQGVGRAPN
jgi:hypothetical protein